MRDICDEGEARVGRVDEAGHVRVDRAREWDAGGMTRTLFPALFVTLAFGACSGFQGLVCSGTNSKQIDREPHVRPAGYGAIV